MANDDLAPNYILEVEGRELHADVTQFIERVEYESADGVVDMARVTVMNPDFLLSSSKVFTPGNEMNIFMGYGAAHVRLIGRVVLMTPRPIFPEDGMPVLEVTGYTKDYLMREQRPDPSNKKLIESIEAALSAATTAKEKRRLEAYKHRVLGSIIFANKTVQEVVSDKAMEYGFDFSEVDDTPMPAGNIIEPAKMSDYDLVQGLSNLTGFIFWVDYNFDTGWTLHFKDPVKDPIRDWGVQRFEYTFKYNQGDLTTLLSFEPEMVFQDHFTSIKVQATDRRPGPRFGKTMEASLVEEVGQEANLEYLGAIEKLEGDLESAEAVKFYIGNFSFMHKTNMQFQSEEALRTYASNWFRRMREHFIAGRGRVNGLETLMARQVHRLEGMGYPYDGKYYFSRVRHVMDRDGGYVCDYNVRKLLEAI